MTLRIFLAKLDILVDDVVGVEIFVVELYLSWKEVNITPRKWTRWLTTPQNFPAKLDVVVDDAAELEVFVVKWEFGRWR